MQDPLIPPFDRILDAHEEIMGKILSRGLVLIGCVIFATLRLTLPVSGLNSADIFKDLAHVWVGIVIGLACGLRSWSFGTMAIGLTVLEVIAALTRG